MPLMRYTSVFGVNLFLIAPFPDLCLRVPFNVSKCKIPIDYSSSVRLYICFSENTGVRLLEQLR